MGQRASATFRIGNFIRDYYSYMILPTVALGIVAGRFFPALTKGLIPYMLYLIAVMIWAMSATIKFADLSQAFTKGRLIRRGLATNFILLPLLCYALAASLMSRYPLYAAGPILMGTAPCAGMNVVWTGLLKGDVALTLLLGALTMILGMATIPALTGVPAGAYVAVDVVGTLRILVAALIIPIILGMFQTINAGVFYKRFQRKLHGGIAVG